MFYPHKNQCVIQLTSICYGKKQHFLDLLNIEDFFNICLSKIITIEVIVNQKSIVYSIYVFVLHFIINENSSISKAKVERKTILVILK